MISLAEWRVCNKSIRLLCPVMASEERLRTSPRWSPRIHRSNACKGRGPTERRPAGIFLALKHIRFEIDFLKTRGKKKKGEKSAELFITNNKNKNFNFSEIDRRNILYDFTLSLEGRGIPIAHNLIVLVCVDSEHRLDAEHRNSGEN